MAVGRRREYDGTFTGLSRDLKGAYTGFNEELGGNSSLYKFSGKAVYYLTTIFPLVIPVAFTASTVK